MGLAPEVASSALNAARASSRKLRMRVRIACRVCSRRGSYRLARLAAKFGPEISQRGVETEPRLSH